MGTTCCGVQSADIAAKTQLEGVPAGENGGPAPQQLQKGGKGQSGAVPLTAEALRADALSAARGAPKDQDFDCRSEGGQSVGASSNASRASSGYEGMSKEQRGEAKRIIKEFVRTMVKGRSLTVVPASGNARTCFVSMSRKLDTLKIRASEKKDQQARPIALVDIEEILVGTDVGGSQACEGLETPLDDLCVTLVLTSLDCITFRMPDMDSRDTLVMCLTMFSNEARAKAEG